SFFWDDIITQMPTFHDLRRLSVSSKLSCIMSRALIHFLFKLPNLESVVIAQ
ncbi:hypothetical protein MKW94_027292, partial [Papaver nudicaule]|nr:hypothetical protein [Papaver nudicaule]